MATVIETVIRRYIGTAAEFATFKGTGATVPQGSTYWVWDTNIIYKTYDTPVAHFVVYITLS